MLRLILTLILLSSSQLMQAFCICPALGSPIEGHKTAAEWFQMGEASYYKGDYHSAVLQFKNAIEESPQFYSAYEFLASAYLEIFDNYSAICTYKHMLRIFPESTDAYIGMAEAKINIGDIDSAIKDLERATLLDPELPAIYDLAVAIVIEHHQADVVFSMFKSVFDSNSAKYYLNIANRLFHKGDYQQADTFFEVAIQLGCDTSVSLINAAVTKQVLGQNAKAEQIFDQAVSCGAMEARAFFFRGAFFYNSQHYKKAISDFDTAISLQPRKALYYYNRGLSYNALDRPDMAKADLTEAISLDDRFHANFYEERAKVFQKLDDFNGAIADYSMLISQYPNNPEFYLLRAKALLHLQRNSDACADLEQAYKHGHQEADRLLERNCAKFLPSPLLQKH